MASPTITITQPGYIYIYLSNEETSPVEVYFDDFRVTNTKSAVIQVDDYYPFGLAFNSYSRENSVPNRWKFQGQEHVDDLGLGWDSFKWRNHQPEIGRFFNIDPLASKYVYNSPYAFSENRVINGRELEGLEWVNSTGQQIYDPKANDGKGGYTEHASNNDKRLGNSLQGTATGKGQFDKLVNSDHPISTEVNQGSEPVYNDKAKGVLQLGKTDNKTEKELSLEGGKMKVEGVSVTESKITINVASIEKIGKEGGTMSGVELKGLSFDQILGAVLGHEIEHTTKENASLPAKGKDDEAAAHEVSKKILTETKDKEKK
jgi:RHS repeat-associated protein